MQGDHRLWRRISHGLRQDYRGQGVKPLSFRASNEGIVQGVFVAQGDVVQRGQRLVEVTADPN